MLARIDSRELSEWHALYLMQPWGDRRDEHRAGAIAAAAANAGRLSAAAAGAKVFGDDWRPADFFPSLAEDSRPVGMKAKLKAVAIAMGADGV